MSEYWDDDPEELAWRAERIAAATERRARELDEQLDRERRWASEYPKEWAVWLRVQPLLDPLHGLFSDRPYDFEAFLDDVGRRPSLSHRLARKDKTLSWRKGNLKWAERHRANRTVPVIHSPYFDIDQAADYCRLARQTIYNRRREIERLPGIRKLLFTQEALDRFLATRRRRNPTGWRRC